MCGPILVNDLAMQAITKNTANIMHYLKIAFAYGEKLMQNRPGLMAVLAFCSGLASFFLVERNASLAQTMAVLLLLSWLWLLLDNWLRQLIKRRFSVELSPNIMRFALQMVHQESLFFTLPFFLVATTWADAQAGFTVIMVLCAIISLIDPLYYKKLALNRTTFIVFHSFSLFVVLLITLPIIFHLSTSKSLAIALVTAIALTIPSVASLMPEGRWWRVPVFIGFLCLLGSGLWQIRAVVPPAALRLTDITLAHSVDVEQKKPGFSVQSLSNGTLHREGLYSWTAVKAPRGLHEKIYHVWLHNGHEVDRIALNITGGREQGYRAWSHKVNFPANSVGKWQVRVETELGQLVGLTRFKVTP